MISLTCGYETETHRHRQQYGGDQRGGGWRGSKGQGGTNMWPWKMI